MRVWRHLERRRGRRRHEPPRRPRLIGCRRWRRRWRRWRRRRAFVWPPSAQQSPATYSFLQASGGAHDLNSLRPDARFFVGITRYNCTLWAQPANEKCKSTVHRIVMWTSACGTSGGHELRLEVLRCGRKPTPRRSSLDEARYLQKAVKGGSPMCFCRSAAPYTAAVHISQTKSSHVSTKPRSRRAPGALSLSTSSSSHGSSHARCPLSLGRSALTAPIHSSWLVSSLLSRSSCSHTAPALAAKDRR